MTADYVLTISRLLDKPIITETRILQRGLTIALKIKKDFAGKKPVLICVEEGGRKWANIITGVLKKLKFDFETGSVTAKSYKEDQSNGDVRIYGYKGPDLRGRTVIILEDILDTFKTIAALDKWAEDMGAASVYVCVMLFKRKGENLVWQIRAFFGHRLMQYVGFYIANLFVIGAGLDYNDFCRELSPDGVYVMTAQAKALLDSMSK